MTVDLGLTMNVAERFPLWALLRTPGWAPDAEVAFQSDGDPKGAGNFVSLIEGASRLSPEPSSLVTFVTSGALQVPAEAPGSTGR